MIAQCPRIKLSDKAKEIEDELYDMANKKMQTAMEGQGSSMPSMFQMHNLGETIVRENREQGHISQQEFEYFKCATRHIFSYRWKEVDG